MTAFNERTAELQLIERLQEALDASPRLPAKVMAHPGSLPKVPMGAVCDVFVKYSGSAFAPPVLDPRGGGTQRRTPQFVILTRIRNVSPQGGHIDAYDYLRRMDASLSGWALPDLDDGEAFAVERERLVDEDEAAGIWLWEQASIGAAHTRPYALQGGS